MENTEQLAMDGDNNAECGDGTGEFEKKKHRHRMKGLLRNIRNQMEFYFGDANINKDRFMKQHLESAPDGYLPLSLFLKFAKIQKLTSSTEVMAKALRKSDLLEVSEDKTKVRRTRPVHYMTEEEVDERTVYVEGLSPTADHDWISQCFSSCGKVTYVSLPRYKTTGDIKGFAFVEFETPMEATKAIEKMNHNPEREEELQKVANFKPSKNLKYWKKRALKEGIDPEKKEQGDNSMHATNYKDSKTNAEKEQQSKKKKRKRRTDDSETEENEQPMKRTKRCDGENSENSENVLGLPCDERQEVGASGSTAEDKSCEDDTLTLKDVTQEAKDESKHETKGSSARGLEPLSEQSPRKRKRKRESPAAEPGLEGETDLVNKTKVTEETEENKLQDMGNAEKKYDEETEKEQYAKKKKLKVKQATKKSSEQSAFKEADSRKGKRKSTDRSEADCAKKSKSDASNKMEKMNTKDGEMNKRKRRKRKKLKKEPPRLRVISKHEWSRLKRQYLDQQRASMASLKQQLHSICSNVARGTEHQMVFADAGDQKSNLRSAPEFQPNVIVEIKSEDPMSHKQLKQRIQSDIKVAYIDVKDNMLHGYIRCKDADSAQKLVASNLTGCMLHLVQGEEERKYWNKMQLDRETKRTNTKRPKKKGSVKLLEKAQNVMLESMKKSHILFEEDWSERQPERRDEENGFKAQASIL